MKIVVTTLLSCSQLVAVVERTCRARLAEPTSFMDLGEVKMGTTAWLKVGRQLEETL